MGFRNDSPSRREFLAGSAFAGAALVGFPASAALAGEGQAPAERSGIRITRIKHGWIHAPRWKVVGRNSQLGLHGRNAGDYVLQIETSAGITGVAQTWAKKEQAAELLGKDPLSFYVPGTGVVSPLGTQDWALWDLVARIHEQPLWRLFGGYGTEWVEVYDGSVYFTDIEEKPLYPEALGTGVDRVLREVEHSLKRGHRAFKIKIGRGNRWMEKKVGFARDVEVVKAIRKLVGPDVKLMVDANNGYDLETTKRFLEAANDDFHFVEEMFPENIARDLELKAWLREKGWTTLVADGESANTVEHFVPYIEARALDTLQGDARAVGFTRLLHLSRLTAQTGIVISPHNWGSLMGNYMQCQLGRGIPNFGLAEEDPGASPFLAAPDYEFKNGRMRVPDTPGSGLVFHEKAYLAEHKYDWVLEAGDV